jgi:hypothetical protein
MGGSDPQYIQAPAPPAAPSASQSIQDYVNAYPQLVGLQQQYGPQTAGLDYQLFQQYAPKYTQTAQDIQSQVYPETSKLQESLATQALQGMNGQLPDWAKQQYQSDFNAGIGSNVNAPIGVSDRNVGLLNLQKQWQDYYRNLGLSVAGRQPLQQTANPTFQNAGSSESVNPFLSYGANTYASQVAGYGHQQQNSAYYRPQSAGSGIGSLIGGIGGASVGGPMGALAGAGIGGSFGGMF